MNRLSRSSLSVSVRKLGSRLPLILGCVGAVLGGAALFIALSVPKIGVVRTDALVYRYAGMKEAQQKYKGKREVWEKEADSLDQEFKAALAKYKAEESGLAATRREARKRELGLLQQSLTQHKSDLAEKAAQEDRELTEGVLSQINEFVETYGKEHGYDIVLGTDGTGNILHSKEYLDVTEDVLDALNRSYRLADNR